MSYEKLTEHLHREGEEKLRLVRQDAEARADEIKEEASRKIGRTRDECGSMSASAIKKQTGAILSDAMAKARMIMLHSEKTFSERPYPIALGSLQALRSEAYPEVFSMLAQELPRLTWQTVRVNPDDAAIAKRYFPDAEIVPEASISGGVDVMTEDGGIRVINTFEKRLERAWTEILRLILQDIYNEIFGFPGRAVPEKKL